VIGDGDMVLCAFQAGANADVAAGLAGRFVTEAAQGSNEVIAADVAGKLQAEMTSSLTMWRRMTLGLSEASKWQETASRIMLFSSLRESACVKMEKPRARAS